MIEKKVGGICTLLLREEMHYDPEANARLSVYHAANPYGDWVGMACVLRSLLDRFEGDKEIKILEVGTAHGHFVYSMREYLKGVGKKSVQAYGLDSMLHNYDPRFFGEDDMHFVKGLSTNSKIINSLDDDFHLIFIDGCHCQNHALLDAINYHTKVRSDGFLGFHDTHPKFQGGSIQPPTPECHADTSIGVVRGIGGFNPESRGYEKVLEEIPLDKDFGGITFFKRETK